MNTREINNRWLRSSANFNEVHRQLENELRRLRDRNVDTKFIEAKDSQIESLVDFYNQTDELIVTLKACLASARIENHMLLDLLARRIPIEDLIRYKPSAFTAIVDTETGHSQILTSLDETIEIGKSIPTGIKCQSSKINQ